MSTGLNSVGGGEADATTEPDGTLNGKSHSARKDQYFITYLPKTI